MIWFFPVFYAVDAEREHFSSPLDAELRTTEQAQVGELYDGSIKSQLQASVAAKWFALLGFLFLHINQAVSLFEVIKHLVVDVICLMLWMPSKFWLSVFERIEKMIIIKC